MYNAIIIPVIFLFLVFYCVLLCEAHTGKTNFLFHRIKIVIFVYSLGQIEYYLRSRTSIHSTNLIKSGIYKLKIFTDDLSSKQRCFEKQNF